LDLEIRSTKLLFIEGSKPEGIEGALFWNEVVFLAAKAKDKPADLYRAEVRIKDGEIISVKGLKNLTDTPAGDEYDLAAVSKQVAVLTKALGQVRSVTVLDFKGQELPPGDEWTTVTRFLARITDLKRTGSFRGIKKTNLRFEKPPSKAALSVQAINDSKERIIVSGVDNDDQDYATIIDESGIPTEEGNLVATEEMRLAKRPILWLVDTVRSLPWVGPGPIEWAEGRFFSVRDAIRRLSYNLVGEEELESDTETGESEDPLEQIILVPAGLEVGETPTDVKWPPPKIDPPVFKRVAKGEGTWRPATPDFVKTLPGAPPATYSTFTRPDQRRPYVRVHLIAMDMRQLELHMVGGYEDPKPTTGSQGTGRIPREPEILDRVTLAFNGAFKTLHGAYGMMVERDVLLPPQAKAATVASMEDGSLLVGSWPEGMGIPGEMTSFRQNMDPVIEDGVVNPRRRYLWGFTLDEDITNMNTIRSGVCMSEYGSLIYAWGEDLTATTLGIAMNAAGCTYGIHLDMNPFHTSFIYYNFKEIPKGKRPEFDSELVFPEMRFSPNRYVNGAPKDFFFVTLKDTAPGPNWEYEGLAQPKPAFVPAVFKINKEQCQLVAVDMSRSSVVIEPGEIPSHLAPGSLTEEKDDHHLVLVDLPLGRWSLNRGQIVRGAVVADLKNMQAALAVDKQGNPKIGVWPVLDEGGETVENAVQASWLRPAEDTKEVTAVGVLKNRWLLVGEGQRNCLFNGFQDHGVTEGVYFHSTDNGPVAAIRAESGLIDLQGNSVTTRDMSNTSLRVLAKPRNLGASKLEDYYGIQISDQNVTDKGKP
jgi:acyl-coenzyme A thioesterase PaaI-like protein